MIHAVGESERLGKVGLTCKFFLWQQEVWKSEEVSIEALGSRGPNRDRPLVNSMVLIFLYTFSSLFIGKSIKIHLNRWSQQMNDPDQNCLLQSKTWTGEDPFSYFYMEYIYRYRWADVGRLLNPIHSFDCNGGAKN